MDLKKVNILQFSSYYIFASLVYILVSYFVEREIGTVEFLFSIGMGSTFGLSYLLLLIRIYFMQKESRISGEIQLVFSFLSLPINFILIYLISNNLEKNLPVFGFLLAYNLHILNIALITKFLQRQND